MGLGLSLVIGYWLKQEDKRQQDAEKPPADDNGTEAEERIVLSSRTLDAADQPPSTDADTETHAETHPQPDTPRDDLTTLDGVGPKTADVLASMGITRFADLAAADPDTLLAQLQGRVRGVSPEKVAAWIAAAQAAEQG